MKVAVEGAAPAAHVAPHRIASVDIVRGAVMVLMALDHVRVFSGIPTWGDPGIFVTRWVTHFCAPAFVFLAGTSAFLHQRRMPPGSSLERFLIVRGAWLIVLELTVLRASWTFNFQYDQYVLAGVIWAIGWCMILLAGLVRLPVKAIAAIGLAIVALHNLLDPVVPRLVELSRQSAVPWLFDVVYLGPAAAGPDSGAFVVLYSVVPWVGVIAAGYAFGAIVTAPDARRRRACLGIGLGATALFIVLRATRVYGDPNPWEGFSIFGFLGTTKYPASLQFLLMTLGPAIALMPALEHARGALSRALAVFGRVPLFYYLLHIPVIHLAACLVSLVRTGRVDPWLFANHPMGMPPPPDGYTWSLPLLYAVTVAVVLALYLPCRWYAVAKAERRSGWMQWM